MSIIARRFHTKVQIRIAYMYLTHHVKFCPRSSERVLHDNIVVLSDMDRLIHAHSDYLFISDNDEQAFLIVNTVPNKPISLMLTGAWSPFISTC